jgi:hypothetical protein
MTDKSRLVKALLKCQAVSNPEFRNALISDLPDGIKNNFNRSPLDRLEVTNLVTRCVDMQNGIETLIDVLRNYEDSSEPMRQVYKTIPSVLNYDSLVDHDLLADLLFILPMVSIDGKDFRKYYRSNLPQLTKPLCGVPSRWQIIEHLASLPLQSDKTLPLLQFLVSISERHGPIEAFDQLKNWINKVETFLYSDLGKIKIGQHSDWIEKDTKPILLVHLIPDPNNRNNRQQEYTINIYAWHDSKTVPKLYSKEKCEEKKIKRKIMDGIDEVIETNFDEDDIDAIEFILPFNRLNLEVDELTHEGYFQEEPRLISDFQVIFRVDRYTYNGVKVAPNLRKRWKKRWKQFCEMKRNNFFHCVDDPKKYTCEKVFTECFNSEPTKTCLIQTFFPNNPEELGWIIVNSGIPVAIWCNKNGHKAEDHMTIKKRILKLVHKDGFNNIFNNISKIHKKPKEDKCLQDHLILFWDDPNRLPLELKYNLIQKTM